MSSPTNILEDFVELDPFAAQVGRDQRTVRRWMDEPDGLPVARIGNRILIHMPTAREWLLRRVKQRNPTRRASPRSGG